MGHLEKIGDRQVWVERKQPAKLIWKCNYCQHTDITLTAIQNHLKEKHGISSSMMNGCLIDVTKKLEDGKKYASRKFYCCIRCYNYTNIFYNSRPKKTL